MPKSRHLRAIYPGSFDPVTYGHVDLIRRAASIFNEVIVAVASNVSKRPLFTVEERLALLRQATRGIRGVRLESFHALTVHYAKTKRASVIIRGLRMVSDFEYEFQMALTNRQLAPTVETIFMMPSESHAYVSSQLIKEAAALGADVRHFVPPAVVKALQAKLSR